MDVTDETGPPNGEDQAFCVVAGVFDGSDGARAGGPSRFNNEPELEVVPAGVPELLFWGVLGIPNWKAGGV